MMSASGGHILTFALSPRADVEGPPSFFRNLQKGFYLWEVSTYLAE